MSARRNIGAGAAFDPTISTSRTPVAVTTPDFRFHLISDSQCAIFQRSRAELLDIEWPAIVHPDDIADPSERQARMIATGEPYEVTCRVLRGDGRWLRGHFSVSRIERGPRHTPLVQASAWFEEVGIPLSNPEKPADPVLALVDYIQTSATELAKMAGQQRLTVLHHLLSMVSLEAAEELQRQYPVFTTLLATRTVN